MKDVDDDLCHWPMQPSHELIIDEANDDTAEERYLDYFVAGSPLNLKLSKQRLLQASHREWILPRALMSESLANCYIWGTTNWRGVARDDWNFVCIRLLTGGSKVCKSGGFRSAIKPGDVCLTDMSRSEGAVWRAASYLALYIHHEDIGYNRTRHLPIRHYPGNKPQGQMIGGMLRQLHSSLRTSPLSSYEELCDVALQGLRALLGLSDRLEPALVDLNRADLAPTRMKTLENYIRSRIRPYGKSPSAAELCQHFGISRATLYRDLSKLGGLERFVSDTRLDSARFELEQSEPTHGIVRQVAERWGYYDASHFNAAFSKKFDVSPSQVVSAKGGAAMSMKFQNSRRECLDASLAGGLSALRQ